MRPRRLIFLMFLCVFLARQMSRAEDVPAKPTPPAQPAQGPGGAAASAAKVQSQQFGEKGASYWLYWPDEPKPETAPVIIFLHGWGGVEPKAYRNWIDHLVQRGNLVIFPRYQENLRTQPGEFMPNAVAAIKDALVQCNTVAGIAPDLTKFAVVGHSAGGALAANLAVSAIAQGLPQPRAVMPVEAAIGMSAELDDVMAGRFPVEDFSKIPAPTLLLVVAGQDDDVAGDRLGRKIFSGATAVPAANRNLITVRSDAHGEPALRATHFAPLAPAAAAANQPGGTGDRPRLPALQSRLAAATDALDYFGYWKWFDALTDAAFTNTNRDYALGNTDRQRNMGHWSDGVPVTPATVETVGETK